LAACGPVADVAPLLRLLGSPNERLRVEAAGVLAGHGHEAGDAALERLALSLDPWVRRQAAIAMGRAAQPAFAPTLVRLLDDQTAIQAAALESLPRVTGRDLPQQLRGRQERIDAWKASVNGTAPAPVQPGPDAGRPRAGGDS
jgi:HEAT repeat protein